MACHLMFVIQKAGILYFNLRIRTQQSWIAPSRIFKFQLHDFNGIDEDEILLFLVREQDIISRRPNSIILVAKTSF